MFPLCGLLLLEINAGFFFAGFLKLIDSYSPRGVKLLGRKKRCGIEDET